MKGWWRSRRAHAVLIAAAIAVVWPYTARALTDEELFREFSFNFINPGARYQLTDGISIAYRKH